MNPLFTIVIPTYNRGYVLWKAIQSVQKQIYPYWELLIVDDGSTDESKRVVAEFQKDPRIHYYIQKKSGGSVARNYGLEKAKGDFVVYLDSDDQLYENYLAIVLDYFTKYPDKVFAIPNYNRKIELYDEKYKLVDFGRVSSAQKVTISLVDFYYWNIFTTSSGIIHKRNIIKSVRWDKNLKIFEDWDFIMQLGNNYPEGFLHIPYVLFEYVQKYGGDSLCSQVSYLDWADGFEAIYQKHKNDLLMKGQTWYPKKVEKFKNLQKLFEKGEVPEPQYKDFPEFATKKS